MGIPKYITRRELLQSAARSWPVRAIGVMLLGAFITAAVIGLWEIRGIVLLVIGVLAVIVLGYAISYIFSSERRRRKLDEDSRLTRSYWSYAYRGMLWSGLGVAAGNLLAYWSSGRDPTNGVMIGGVCMAFGALAWAVWIIQRRKVNSTSAGEPAVHLWGSRLKVIFLVCLAVLALAYVAAAGFGHGGRGSFSPDTLDSQTQHEWLLPGLNLPLYRGPIESHRYPLVDYLVAQGYWAPSTSSEPRWIHSFQWNVQWKDGQSALHREFSWRGEFWIEWTKDHPSMAKVLWPRVLTALRSPDDRDRDLDTPSHLLRMADSAGTVEEFESKASILLLK